MPPALQLTTPIAQTPPVTCRPCRRRLAAHAAVRAQAVRCAERQHETAKRSHARQGRDLVVALDFCVIGLEPEDRVKDAIPVHVAEVEPLCYGRLAGAENYLRV